MRKLINDPFDVVDDYVAGLRACYGEQISVTSSGRGVATTRRSMSRRVALVSGGGSGHEPAFAGYVGLGLLDAVAVGNVFAAPAATPIIEAVGELADCSEALFMYGNYEGDIMNFDMAAELLAERGIRTKTCIVTDDVASAPPDAAAKRRGVAGEVLVYKAAGACADRGSSLDDVHRVACHANDRVRSIGVGLGPCVVPAAGVPTFDQPEGTLDIGIGVHGEAGLAREPLRSSREVADQAVRLVVSDFPLHQGARVIALVNGFGATPVMEGYIFAAEVARALGEHGIEVDRLLVGEYLTSLEMVGVSLSVMWLDDELAELMSAPAEPLFGPRL